MMLTITTELDPLNQSLVLLTCNALPLRSLAKQRNDRHTRVASDNCNLDFRRVCVLDLTEESRCSDDIESGDTVQSIFPISYLPCTEMEDEADFFSSKTPAPFMTSAKMGTVELTGFEMIKTWAFGQFSATALARSRTIEALVFCCPHISSPYPINIATEKTTHK
jgi:hypothetical protein